VTTIDAPDSKMLRGIYRNAAQKTFRGEIWEDDTDAPMGKGYANNSQPFDITTAFYLRAVFMAIRNRAIRKVVIRAAVQTLKTFVVEKSASYFIKNDPADMVLYDCDIEAASDHSKSRFMPFLKGLPSMSRQIQQAESINRHDITTTEFYLPGMTLRVWPLNESSTQRITIRDCFISDAFLSKRTGMIKQAIARTTQHPHDKKIIIESQGSDEGDDFDAEFQTTNQTNLYAVCPYCETNQPFTWERERPSDFTPVEPKSFWKEEGLWVPPKAGTFSGMIRGDASPDRKHGDIDAAAVLSKTHYECYHCGAMWRDTPEIRKRLDQSANYVAQNPSALPENVGFSWPFWINQRLRWGADDYGMLAYLQAKKLDKETGNRDPLKQWFQKRAGMTWRESIGKDRAKIITISDQTADSIKNEAARLMMIDCQQHPDLSQAVGKSVIGHFWYVAWAVDQNARNIHQLSRGYAKSWEELLAVQEKLKIPNSNVAIDGGNWLEEVIQRAAKHWKLGFRDIGGKRKPCRTVWTVMRGNGVFKSRKGTDGVWRPFTEPSYYRVHVEIPGYGANHFQVGGKMEPILVPVLEWSNLSIKDQLFSIRLGGEGKPTIHALSRERLDAQTREMETGPKTYESQVTNEVRSRTKAGKDIWEELNPNVHYNDCECMGIVQCIRGGLLGIPAMQEDSEAV
jgi:hypothetical protein